MNASEVEQKLMDPGWAWAAYQPDAERPWDRRKAGHLYRRAAFGGSWSQLQTALTEGPAKAIDKLVQPAAGLPSFNQAQDEYERAAAQSATAANAQAWWLRRMMETPHPLQEQMTLFWHNFFGISNARVGNPALMCRYIQLLRHSALARFDTLLAAVIHEPAVLLCLDAKNNFKPHPNENFGKALLERYTVGPGQFSEPDALTTARAFTGWCVSGGESRYVAREHDGGSKNLFGESGTFDGNDALRILFRQPATAGHVIRALYRWFISETNPPADSLIAPLVADFAKDFDAGRLVEVMLRSNLFFSPVAYRQKIKSPVEFAIGVARALNTNLGALPLSSDLTDLGQELYEPPTIKGWAGHRCWLNPFTVLGRAKLAQAIFSDTGPYEGKLASMLTAHARSNFKTGGASDFIADLFVQSDLPAEVAQTLAKIQTKSPESLGSIAAITVSLPEFQLA